MSEEALYLRTNRIMAQYAAHLSAGDSVRHTDDPVFIFLANLSTISNFAEVALGYIALRAIGKATDAALQKTWTNAKSAADRLAQRCKAFVTLSGDLRKTQTTEAMSEADEAVEPMLKALADLSADDRAQALEAGAKAAETYLRDALGFEAAAAHDVARGIFNEIRDRAKGTA